MKSPCKKGLTEEEKIMYVRRETLQGLIEAMQAKEDTGASKGEEDISSDEEQIEGASSWPCAVLPVATGARPGTSKSPPGTPVPGHE